MGDRHLGVNTIRPRRLQRNQSIALGKSEFSCAYRRCAAEVLGAAPGPYGSGYPVPLPIEGSSLGMITLRQRA
jgi:hypothetical protein